jgi:hypothetical protein
MFCVGLTLWRNAGIDRPAVAQRDLESPLPITSSVVSMWDNVQLQSQQAAVETVRRFEGIPQVAFQEPIPGTPPSAVGTSEPVTSPRPWLEWGQPLGRQVGQAFQFLGDALPDPNDHSAG